MSTIETLISKANNQACKFLNSNIGTLQLQINNRTQSFKTVFLVATINMASRYEESLYIFESLLINLTIL